MACSLKSRKPTMSQVIQELFNNISPHYDRLNHFLSFNRDKSWRRKTIDAIAFPKDQPIKALDLCAGTLDLSLLFLKHFPQAQVVAADFSQAMLDVGLAKVTPPDKERFTTVCADALNLPFEPASFDVLFCGFGFRNLDDPRRGLSEMKRVLKPGGQLLILEFFKPANAFTRFFDDTYSHFVIPALGSAISRNREAYEHLRDSIRRFFTRDECCRALAEAGFQNIKARSFTMGICSLITAHS